MRQINDIERRGYCVAVEGVEKERVSEVLAPITCGSEDVNRGLPPLNLADKPYARFEFLPAWIIYGPIVLWWLILGLRYRSFGLPMLANPAIPLGGMVGESKSEILNLAEGEATSVVLPYILVSNASTQAIAKVLAQMASANLEFPVVAKPDLGCRGAGVKKIHEVESLIQYLRQFSPSRDCVIQQLSTYEAEAGVFYVRHPHQARGEITSVTLKYVPWVRGDGKKTLRELILDNARAKHMKKLFFHRFADRLHEVVPKGSIVRLGFSGSHCLGSIFRDGAEYITPELTAAIDQVMQGFPGVYYGRLDIKFRDINSFRHGKLFDVIELNGASSEATHIWDSRGSLFNVYKTLMGQYRTLFQIGAVLRRKGLRPPSAYHLIKTWLVELFAT